MAVFVKVRKWNGRLAIVIPQRFAVERAITVGTVIDLETLQVGQPKRRRYRLSELMSGFKSRHRYGEYELGGTIGREALNSAPE